MGQVLGLMKEYFDQSRSAVISESLPKETPIQPKKAEWKMSRDPGFLVRSYKFDNDDSLRWFVNEILLMQKDLKHHAYILIDENIVNVKVGTKTLKMVTELDIEFATNADSVYHDSQHIMAEQSE